MATRVALLRGINVAGKNSLSMQELRDILVELGCEVVETYIQSGNVVSSSDADEKGLAAEIGEMVRRAT